MEKFFAPQQILPRVFFLSGLSSLLFQVAFQRLLTLYYGVGPVSVTLIVSVYMLGLGVGGYLGGVIADKTSRPFLAYALVETTLAVFGVLSLPYLDIVARHTSGADAWVSLLSMCAVLAVPTVAMGMTLPLVVKLFNRGSRNLLGSVSYLYSVNTLGAATGALLAAFLVISFFGLDACVFLGAGIDLLLVLLIYVCLRSNEKTIPQQHAADDGVCGDDLLGNWAYLAVFVTGLLAIGYEIVWFRLLQILVKSSPYAFASTLGVYLFGIAIGSNLMNTMLARNPKLDRQSVFFWLQGGIAITASMAVIVFYHLSGNLLRSLVSMSYTGAGITGFLAKVPFLFLVLWPFFFLFVPTLLMGASFPLITYLSCKKRDADGQAVGTTYFFNTAGNVIGGVLTGFLLLPVFGTEVTFSIFAVIGISMLFFARSMPFGLSRSKASKYGFMIASVVLILIAMPQAGKLYLAIHSTGIPPEVRSQWHDYITEGVGGVVVTHEAQPANYQVVINGLGHGRRPDYKYYREAIEALSYAGNVEKVLIIGFGGGSTTWTVEQIKDVSQITIVEINDALIGNLKQIPLFKEILADPRITLVLEDCRRYLLSTRENFDMILLDPLRTSEAYSNNIYSRQFFELVKSRLRQPGMVLVWLDEHKVLPKTIATVFPHVRVYNYFCLASLEPFDKNSSREEELLARFSAQEKESIFQYKTEFRGDGEKVRKESQGYPINEDMRPNTEYYLGLVRFVGQ